jgi:hypothetical protein
MKAHLKEHPAWFHRFEAVWTPTVLLLGRDGKERMRLEGYLPNSDFLSALEAGLGRIAFVDKKYVDAERWHGDVVTRFSQSHSAPEALYWRAVAHYKATTSMVRSKQTRRFLMLAFHLQETPSERRSDPRQTTCCSPQLLAKKLPTGGSISFKRALAFDGYPAGIADLLHVMEECGVVIVFADVVRP